MSLRLLAALLCVACCLTGCDWQRLREIRGQLEQFPQYVRWNGAEDDRTLVFLQPVLTASDLADLGFHPADPSARRLSIKYRYRVAGQGPGRDTEMIFLVDQGKVRAVVFPKELVELIGQDNVGRLLRIAGGDSSLGAGLRAVPKSRVLGVALGGAAPASGYRKISFEFVPQERANRGLTLQLEENAAGDAYNKFRFDFRSWGKQHPET